MKIHIPNTAIVVEVPKRGTNAYKKFMERKHSIFLSLDDFLMLWADDERDWKKMEHLKERGLRTMEDRDEYHDIKRDTEQRHLSDYNIYIAYRDGSAYHFNGEDYDGRPLHRRKAVNIVYMDAWEKMDFFFRDIDETIPYEDERGEYLDYWYEPRRV